MFLNLKLIAYEIAELLSENHDLDVDSGDVLKGLVRFLETAAPGCVVDTVGAAQALAQGADVPVTIVIDEVQFPAPGADLLGISVDDLPDGGIVDEMARIIKSGRSKGTIRHEPPVTQASSPEAFGSAFWGDLREDLKDPALREQYLKAQALAGPVTFEPDPTIMQKPAPAPFGKDTP